jgi:hypothetical protein
MDCRVKSGLRLRSEAIMTAYLISLALVGLIAIALSEAFA